MTKVVSFSLSALLVWQIIGVFGIFQITRMHIRKEIKSNMKKGVSENDLTTFIFRSEEHKGLKWRKKNEFVWQGHFYDVVKKNVDTDGNITIQCISDKQEDKLFEGLGKWVAQSMQDEHSTSTTVHWNYILKLTFLMQSNGSERDALFTQKRTETHYRWNAMITQYCLVPEHLPPSVG